MKTIGIIPSRYGSTRFPGKPLANILGKSMIQRVYEQCKKCSKLTEVIVATDDNRIYTHVLDFGGNVMMSSKEHLSGTERCNEIAHKIEEKFDIIVNIQGDEPFIEPSQINEIIEIFEDPTTEIATLAKKIDNIDIIEDENTPKAIVDNDGNALNFYRKESSISTEFNHYKHIGIYAYKKDVLKKICQLQESKNEKRERLEQLRWLDNNYNIKVGVTDFETFSIDTPDDMQKLKP
jgi:3-deoxy-manno-octulosonate cytidylyltransferase (CMP-KDO synthetase)